MTQALNRAVSGHRNLITGSVWLLVATFVAAFGGFLFWVVAAHVDSTATVGRASALFTSAMFLNYATGMGLTVAVARYANDRSRDARVLFEWGLLYTAASSLVGTLVFLALIPNSVEAPLDTMGRPLGLLLYFAVVTGMSFTLLVDVRLMAIRRWDWIVGRASLVACLRVPLLFLRPLQSEALWLFLLIGGSQAISGLVGAVVLQRGRWEALRPLPAQALRALRYASVNFLGQLAIQAPFFVVPVLVLLNVRPATNAVFYIAWSVMAVVFVTVQMIGQALLVEGGKEGARLGSQVRVTLALGLGFTCVSAIAAYLGARVLTAVYGASYADAAGWLPMLILATIPWSVTSALLAEARVREDTASTVAISVPFALLVLVPAALLTANDGVDGTTRAWLYGNVAAAIVAMTVSYVAKVRGRAHSSA
jgi:O-antigen/teichoic acid export membrane protein